MGTYTLSKIKAMAKGDDTFLKNVLAKFLENNKNLMSETLYHLNEGDLDKCKKIVHTMKTSMNLVDAKAILSVIHDIEALEESQLNFQISLFDMLREQLQDILSQIQQEYELLVPNQ